MQTNPFLGPLKGWALKTSTFVGPEMALALLVAISGTTNVSIFRAHPFNGP